MQRATAVEAAAAWVDGQDLRLSARQQDQLQLACNCFCTCSVLQPSSPVRSSSLSVSRSEGSERCRGGWVAVGCRAGEGSIAAGQLGCTRLSGRHWPQLQLAAGCQDHLGCKPTGGCKSVPPSPGPAIAFSLKAAATAAGSCRSFTSHSCSSARARCSYPSPVGTDPQLQITHQALLQTVTPANKLAETCHRSCAHLHVVHAPVHRAPAGHAGCALLLFLAGLGRWNGVWVGCGRRQAGGRQSAAKSAAAVALRAARRCSRDAAGCAHGSLHTSRGRGWGSGTRRSTRQPEREEGSAPTCLQGVGPAFFGSRNTVPPRGSRKGAFTSERESRRLPRWRFRRARARLTAPQRCDPLHAELKSGAAKPALKAEALNSRTLQPRSDARWQPP